MKLNVLSLVVLASCLSGSAQTFPGGSLPGGSPATQFCFDPGPCIPPPPGLVAWYTFDDTNGQEEDIAAGSKHSTGWTRVSSENLPDL